MHSPPSLQYVSKQIHAALKITPPQEKPRDVVIEKEDVKEWDLKQLFTAQNLGFYRLVTNLNKRTRDISTKQKDTDKTNKENNKNETKKTKKGKETQRTNNK